MGMVVPTFISIKTVKTIPHNMPMGQPDLVTLSLRLYIVSSQLVKLTIPAVEPELPSAVQLWIQTEEGGCCQDSSLVVIWEFPPSLLYPVTYLGLPPANNPRSRFQ